MKTIWVLTGTDETKPLRAYRNKGRGEQDLELLNALEGIYGFELNELPIYDADEPAIAASVTPAKTVEKKDTLAECVAAIRSTFIMPLDPGATDRTVRDQLKERGHSYKLPTVRNAMIEIGKPSRAASETVSDVNGKDQGSPSDTGPDRSGAGTPFDEAAE